MCISLLDPWLCFVSFPYMILGSSKQTNVNSVLIIFTKHPRIVWICGNYNTGEITVSDNVKFINQSKPSESRLSREISGVWEWLENHALV